jgi:single-stranded-DNA-specific exonuclease
MKQWIINTPDEQKAAALSEETGLSPLAAEVLMSNGCGETAAVQEFFGDGKLSDPFLITGMKEAADAVNLYAFARQEKICVYGDYDCDGVCASVVLYTFLISNGADVICHINSREQGFGLNADVIKELAENGVKLIITVDNGIAALEEADLIRELGMEAVITDHHEPGENLPTALAVVNPHRDSEIFNEYCGCGVALMLVAALMTRDTEDGVMTALEGFADLAALATVADMVPLVGENRLIVSRGLESFAYTENPGLVALIKVAGIKPPFTTTHMGFAIAPRINAAGRLAHAKLAFDLLTCEDAEKAEELARQIDNLNTERKTIESEVLAAAIQAYNDNPEFSYKRILCINLKNANHGVIGLAAGKLTEHTGKPAFLMTDDGEDYLRGSARSVPGCNVFEALTYCKDFLTKFGGHALAGGFSLGKSDFPRFAAALEEFAAKQKPLPPGSVTVCKRLLPHEITIDNARSMGELEPFGQGFPQPIFLINGAVINAVTPSADGKHTKLTLKYDQTSISTVKFGVSPENFNYKTGDKIDILTYFGVREFGGRDYLNFKLCDMRLSGIPQQKMLNAALSYESWRRNEYSGSLDSVKPSREDFAVIYRQLPDTAVFIDSLYERNKDSMNYFKLRVILDAFCEAGLVNIDLWDKSVIKHANPAKAVLETTATMKRFG